MQLDSSKFCPNYCLRQLFCEDNFSLTATAILKVSNCIAIYCKLLYVYISPAYHITGNIDMEFNLMVWRSPDQPSNKYPLIWIFQYYKPWRCIIFVKLKFTKCYCVVNSSNLFPFQLYSNYITSLTVFGEHYSNKRYTYSNTKYSFCKYIKCGSYIRKDLLWL